MAVSGGRQPPRGPQGQSLGLPERAHRSLDTLSELRAIFDGLYELAGYPTKSVTADDIAQTRRQGYARTSEFIPGISGIAAPVYDHSGSMTLALVALGYSKPFEAAIEKISAAVVSKAAALSQRLGAV